jgi:hypothetical protein
MTDIHKCEVCESGSDCYCVYDEEYELDLEGYSAEPDTENTENNVDMEQAQADQSNNTFGSYLTNSLSDFINRMANLSIYRKN